MIIMSLRDGALPSKQSPVSRGDIVPFGDCFAKCACNDMPTASLREVKSQTGEGVTLTREEFSVLRDVLNSMEL